MISEADILKNHCLWQRSWTGELSAQPIKLQSRLSRSPRSSTSTWDTPKYIHQLPDQSKVPSYDATPSTELPSVSAPPLNRRWKSIPTDLGCSLSEDAQTYIYNGSGSQCIHKILEDRRQQRISRRRPWTERVLFAPSRNRNENIEFFYENHLPHDVNADELKRRSRKYVANVKYGNIYELRKNEKKTTEKDKPESSNAWLWERDFELWLTDRNNGSRKDKLGGEWAWDLSRTTPKSSTSTIKPEDAKSTKTQAKSIKQSPISVSNTALNKVKQTGSLASQRSGSPSCTSTPSSTPRPASRITGRSTPRNKLRSSKDDKPHADLFAHYNSYRLERQRKRDAAIVIQKVFRGWLVRKFIEKLKRKARLEHYTAWNRFILEYRELVKRVQERYGINKPSCGVDLKELEAFMDIKKKYESAFHHLSYGDKLLKEDLLEFFHDSGLFPTEGDVTKAFNSVFKGNGYTAEVIFVLDCSTSTGPLSFYHLTNFVKDVVSSVDIAPNKVRVGVVPYSDDVFQSFGITDYHMKHDVHRAIDDIKFKEGLTRTDLALRKTKSYMMAARPGVQKLCIVITDGKSSEPQKTVHAAKEARADNIEIIAIGVGRRTDLEELRAIASSDRHLLTACDYGALSSLKNVLDKKTCLGSIYNKTSNLKEQCRPLQKAEAMEVLWTAYPPSACKLKARSSRWIRPIVNGTEAWSLLDQNIVSSTDTRTCLRLVIQAKIEREGYVTLPSTVREGVEQVSNCDEALRIIENWLKHKKENSAEMLHEA